MLKFARNSLIVFDFEEALSFEGETGPYLQYTDVRLRSIFRKLEERTGTTEDAMSGPPAVPAMRRSIASGSGRAADLWDLVLYAAAFEEEVLRDRDPARVLAPGQVHLQPLPEDQHLLPSLSRPGRGGPRPQGDPGADPVPDVRGTLEKALSLMGIPLPERM